MTGYSAQGQITVKRSRKGDNGLDGVSYQIRTSVEIVRCAQDGTPSVASFTASLWRSQGDSNAVNVSATFKCNGETVGTGTSVTIPTANGTTIYTLTAFVDNEIKSTKSVGISKDGGNTAVVQLFRRSATALTDSDRPTGTLTYTFSTKQLSGSGFNSWSQNVPADNGNPLYITTAIAFASGDTDTIAATEWSTPVLYTKDGTHTAPVFLYRRSATALTSSDRPTGTLTYTFATGLLSGSGFNSWSQSVPATNGNPLYIIQATATSNGTTDTIASSEWSIPVKFVEDGADGSDGADGADGVTPTIYFLLGSCSQLKTTANRSLNPSCTVTGYSQRGNDAPVALTNATTNTIAVRGYNANGQTVYSADGANSMTFSANSRTTTSYGYAIRFEITLTVGSNTDKLTIPVVLDGADGADGQDGRDGRDGTDGSNGADAVIYDIVLTEGWAKADPSTNEISARLKGYAYRITGSTRVALNGATIRHGYILNDDDTYATVQTNSSGYFDAGTWFDGDYTYDYAKDSATIFAAIIINNTVVCVRYVQIMKDGRSITGAQGYNGCVPRLFDVGLVSGQTYYCNDTAINTVNPNVLDNADGIRHIDAVAVLDATMQSGYAVYQCKRNYTATQNAQTKAEFESISDWSTYFVKVSENAASAYFTFLMAQNAFIKMLAGAMMVVQDENANVIGGMQGNPSLPIFWAGAQLPANGLWQQMANGFASYGTPNGEHIELDPVNKTISFYNSSGQLVTEHNAKTYSSLSSLLPSAGTFTVVTTQQTLQPNTTIWYNVENVVSVNLSEIIAVSANGVLKIQFTKFYCTIMTPSGTDMKGLIKEPTANFALYLYKYGNSTGTTYLGRTTLRNYTAYGAYDNQTYSAGYNQSTVNDAATASVQSGYYYRLVAVLTSSGGNNSVQSTCRGYAKMTSASIVADYYSSKFFGNGLILSKNTSNYFAALLESTVFRFVMTNAYYGLDISSSGMKARRGDYWHKQPITLMAIRITQSGESQMSVVSYNGVSFIANSTSPSETSGAVYLISQGQFRIYFPTNWQGYSLGTNGFPQATVTHYNGNEDGYLCYVQSISNTQLVVWTADDWSSNYGSVYVELKMF